MSIKVEECIVGMFLLFLAFHALKSLKWLRAYLRMLKRGDGEKASRISMEEDDVGDFGGIVLDEEGDEKLD